jgi:hypothetical protein
MAKGTCRDEILQVMAHLESIGRSIFTPDDIVREMRWRGSRFADSTIRTHVVSRMCANAPGHHAVTYEDLERIGPGFYRQRV